MFNPFPGLRPFEADEDHLFFGREREIDELLRRLRLCRFLSIVGTSGCGKSSLVRSGLIPSLGGGSMAQTNPDWRVAIMRPGEDPLRHLAEALNAPEVLGITGELESTNSILIEATLRRGTRGLVEAVRQARIPPGENLLIVVDQFEELFRFRRNFLLENSRDEAVAFVKMILEAAQQQDLPIYIVITMRSDFIGDCMDFSGLPEAVNSGLYLVPRMSRDELRSAITGPVAVGGGNITQRLVLRLLNDFGDEYDQLPILQHAMMRTWDHWQEALPATEGIDIDDYDAIGGFRRALSIHAEEAYAETGSDEEKKITEKIFKALTDTFSDHRGIRRPTSVRDLASICEASEAKIIRIIEVFRRPGRSFLMPPADVPLEAISIIDLSHESLMRCWERLSGWAEQERTSAEIYARLSDAALWYKEGKAGLWRNPELEVGEKWRLLNRPTAAWAQRYNGSFAQVMNFLDSSGAERERLSAEKRAERRRKFRQIQWAAGILGSLFLIAVFFGYFAWRQTQRAETNLQLAKKAVDESLSSVGSQQAREASDLPQMEELRKGLLDKAATFYTLFARQNSTDLSLRAEEARAHSRLGDINRLMGKYHDAAQEYKASIDGFGALAKAYPGQAEFRQGLAYAHNWLGETIREGLDNLPGFDNYKRSDAEGEYAEALRLQEGLHEAEQHNVAYQQELARTYYNRGIIRFQMNNSDGVQSDFRKAIALLEPLVPQMHAPSDSNGEPDPAQDLARVYNNYAIVVSRLGRIDEARGLYEKAIGLAEQFVKQRPQDREYQAELSQYSSNEARMLTDGDQPRLAELHSQRSLDMLQQLAKPTPSLALKIAQALQLRGQLLLSQDANEAEALTDQAFEMLKQIDGSTTQNTPLLSATYMNIGVNYLELSQDALRLGNTIRAGVVLARVNDILPRLSKADKETLESPYKELLAKLHKGPIRH